jgi:hypothetical protein
MKTPARHRPVESGSPRDIGNRHQVAAIAESLNNSKSLRKAAHLIVIGLLARGDFNCSQWSSTFHIDSLFEPMSWRESSST